MPRKKRLEAIYNVKQLLQTLWVELSITGEESIQDEIDHHKSLLRLLEREWEVQARCEIARQQY